MKLAAEILMFAAATSILYVWGLKKSISQKNSLLHLLNIKGKKKVIKYLKKNGQITTAQIEKEINKISAGEFYSRKKAVVADPETFSKNLVGDMKDQGILAEEMVSGKRIYKLKEKI